MMDEGSIVPLPSPAPAWTATAVSLLVWVGVVGWSGLTEPDIGPLALGCALGWIGSLTAVLLGSGLVYRADRGGHYSGFGEFGGALLFLLIPPMTLAGAPWTLGAAYKLGVSGIVDGARVGDSFGHSFKRVPIGTAGRPLAAALVVVTLGWVAALASAVYAHRDAIHLVPG